MSIQSPDTDIVIEVQLHDDQEQRSGTIINVASALALRGLHPSHIGYDVAKGCVCGMTRALALQLAPAGVRVNAIAQSSTLTEATRETGEDDAELYRSHPMGRAAEPDEVAGAIAFLASGWSTYCTGETLIITGGQFIGSTQI